MYLGYSPYNKEIPSMSDDFLISFQKHEIPTLNISPPIHEGDIFCCNLLSSKPDDIKELINGGWILQYYLKRPCPDPVADWIFHIMCLYPDPFVTSQCFETLWALLRAGTEVC